MPEFEGGVQVLRAPTREEELEKFLPAIKQFRKDVDELIQRTQRPNETGDKSISVNDFKTKTEALDEVRVNLIQAKMWAGKMLEYLGSPFPKELADKSDN